MATMNANEPLQHIKITNGEYALGIFTNDLHEDGGSVIINGYEYSAWIENGEVVLALPEVDVYHAIQEGRPWEDMVATLVNQAVTQLETAGNEVSGLTVGYYLSQRGHFLLPEEIAAALWGQKNEQTVLGCLSCWIKNLINPPENREPGPQIEYPRCSRCHSQLCFSYLLSMLYCPRCDDKDGNYSLRIGSEE